MTAGLQHQPEVLIARKIPWRKRLWVRGLLLFLLLNCVCVGVWWWPRRTMVAVWRAGGWVYCKADSNQVMQALDWWDPNYQSWLRTGTTVDQLEHVLGWTRQDREITYVNLYDAEIDQRWFARLQKFPQLDTVFLHGRQMGPGLEQLRDHRALKFLCVKSASGGQLAELKRLPQLNGLFLTQPQCGTLNVEFLADLPALKSLLIMSAFHPQRLLAKLPELPRVETLTLQDCQGMRRADDLDFLQRLPGLKYLSFHNAAILDDQGLARIAQLPALEHLHLHRSVGIITDEGLESLGRLTKLKELTITGASLSAEQEQKLQRLLPETSMFVR